MKGLKIIFLISKFCGLAPFSVLEIIDDERSPFCIYYHDLILNVILFLSQLLIFVFYLYQYDLEENSPETATMYTVSSLNYFMSRIIFNVVFLVLIVYTKKAKSAIKIGNKLLDIHRFVIRFHPNYLEGIEKQQFRIVCSIFTVYLINWIICITFQVSRLFEMFSISLAVVIVNGVVIQYACVAVYFKSTLRLINQELKKLDKNEKKNDFWLKNARFALLRNCWLRLLHANKHVAKFFSIPMLGCVVQAFFFVVINAYYLVRPIVYESKFIYGHLDFIAIFWFISISFFLITITNNVTEVTNQV